MTSPSEQGSAADLEVAAKPTCSAAPAGAVDRPTMGLYLMGRSERGSAPRGPLEDSRTRVSHTACHREKAW